MVMVEASNKQAEWCAWPANARDELRFFSSHAEADLYARVERGCDGRDWYVGRVVGPTFDNLAEAEAFAARRMMH